MKRLPDRLGRHYGALAVIVAALLLTGIQATAAKGPKRLLGLTFPENIAGTKLAGYHNFEKKNPGLGHSVEYRAPGWKINVYIYDLKKSSIPGDLESVEISSQFKQAEGDIYRAQDKGVYTVVERVRSYTLKDLSKRARMKCATFSLTHKSAGALDSFLCLTSWRGKFLKFRMSVGGHENSEAEARQYLGAWIAHIWPNH